MFDLLLIKVEHEFFGTELGIYKDGKLLTDDELTTEELLELLNIPFRRIIIDGDDLDELDPLDSGMPENLSEIGDMAPRKERVEQEREYFRKQEEFLERIRNDPEHKKRMEPIIEKLRKNIFGNN